MFKIRVTNINAQIQMLASEIRYSSGYTVPCRDKLPEGKTVGFPPTLWHVVEKHHTQQAGHVVGFVVFNQDCL